MKRLYFLILIAVIGLSACTATLTVEVDEVEISTGDQIVAPGAEVTLKATANFETRILWSVSDNDGRAPQNAFENEGVGETVVYIAPQAPGVYTITARSPDSPSLRDSVKVTVDEFLGLEPLEAGTELDTTVTAGNLVAGEEKLFLINVSSEAAAAGSALFIELDVELDDQLDLTVLNEDRSVYATSDSAEFFASGTAGLSNNGLAPQTITISRKIPGPHVIQNAVAGNEYVKVKNTSGEAVSYKLNVFVIDYLDSGEPNNSASTAQTLDDEGEIAALESLGDNDYYIASSDGKLCFQSNSWDNARVNVSNVDGFDQTIVPGGSTSLREGDLIRVYEESGDVAAGAAASKYIILVQPSGTNCP